MNLFKRSKKTLIDFELDELATLKGHKEMVTHVSFSPDGQCIATSSQDKTIQLWGMPGGRLLCTLKGHTDNVKKAFFSSDSKILASYSLDDTVRLWDTKNCEELAILKHNHHIESIAFSPDGSMLATASGFFALSNGPEENVIKLWGVPSGKEISTLKGHGPCPKNVAFSPDGALLASGWVGGRVTFWKIPEMREAFNIDGPDEIIFDMAFHPNGLLLSIATFNESIILYKIPGGKRQGILSNLDGKPTSIAFSPAGTVLAVELTKKLPDESFQKSLSIWDINSRRQIFSQKEPNFRNPSFSPDGTLLVTLFENEIKVWGISSPNIEEFATEKQTPWAVEETAVKQETVMKESRASRKLTKNEVLAIIKKAKETEEKPDLSGFDLSGIDLSGMDLKEANLNGVNLSGANLSGINLDYAKLTNANLCGADLTDAKLSAHLENANLKKAKLSGATLDFAQLQRADLSEALLDDEAALRSANLSRANLSKAVLIGAHIQRANLLNADLSGTILTDAFLDQTVMPDGKTYGPGMDVSRFGAKR